MVKFIYLIFLSHILLFTALSNCANGDVRLVDGKNEQEGRVEVCQNRVWGAIVNRWTFQEAKVVCIHSDMPQHVSSPGKTSLILLHQKKQRETFEVK